MTDHSFSEALFKKTFSVKEDKPASAFRLNHTTDKYFKLFPYKATPKTASPIIENMAECISEFFRNVLEMKTASVDRALLCEQLKENLDIDDDDIELFDDIISSLFFRDGKFYAYNIGSYPYQTEENKSAEKIAEFIYCVFGLDHTDKGNVEDAIDRSSFNVLERMVVDTINAQSSTPKPITEKYYQIVRSVQRQFKADLAFMLSSNMTSVEDLTDLLSFYYFYYVSQTCITLDQFGNGSRDRVTPLYFALDWEKVSKNRKCCEEGWTKLQGVISRMFSHAVTLEIINQSESTEMLDYIGFKTVADQSEDNDIWFSNEIKKAEATYVSYIGDCPKIRFLPEEPGANHTDAAIRHLFKCVSTQFNETERKRASQLYSEKFSDFCKKRFVKNRKKSGLTLNLTEQDVIFLTKLAIQNNEKMRLIDLYKEFERRGVYLDLTSKGLLQEYFTKLNLIDKKSDSGDAQYVKRIL